MELYGLIESRVLEEWKSVHPDLLRLKFYEHVQNMVVAGEVVKDGKTYHLP